MDIPWRFRGVTIDSWRFHGVSIKSSWNFYGVSRKFPGFPQSSIKVSGRFNEVLWSFRSGLIECPLRSMKVSLRLHGNSMEF